VIDITTEGSQSVHAPVETPVTFVVENGSHVQQLLLTVDVDTLCNQFESFFTRWIPVATIVRTVILGERTDLSIGSLSVDDFDEKKQGWPDKPSLALSQSKQQNQVVCCVLFRDAHFELELPRPVLS